MGRKSSALAIVIFFAFIPCVMIIGGLILGLVMVSDSRTTSANPEEIFAEGSALQFESAIRSRTSKNSDDKVATQESKTEKRKSSPKSTPPHSKNKVVSSVKNTDSKGGERPKGELAKQDEQEKKKTKSNKNADAKKKSEPAVAPWTISATPPDWADGQSIQATSDQTFVIKTDIELPESVQQAVNDRALVFVQEEVVRRFGNRVADNVHIGKTFLERNLILRRHREQLSPEKTREILGEDQTDLDPLQYEFGYAEIALGKTFESEVQRQFRRRQQDDRLAQILLIGGAFVLVLVIGFSYFSTDRATRGMYTVRLQLGTVLLLVLAGLLVTFFVAQLQWI